jgi:Tfp pilus assembly protein PilN
VVGVQNRDGGWRPMPELLFSYWLPESNLAQGTRRELLQQCVKTASHLFSWGAGREVLSSGGGHEALGQDLVEAGNRKLRGLKIDHASVLPAVGAALRGYVNGALAALLVLALCAWAVVYPIKDELRLRQLQAEIENIEPAVAALRREEEALQKARAEQYFFAALDQRRGEVLRVLEELTNVVPARAYLSNLRYRAGSVEVQGSAENASGLIPLLERSPLFENVGFNAPSNRGRDNRETFSLRAELEQSKEKSDEADRP